MKLHSFFAKTAIGLAAVPLLAVAQSTTNTVSTSGGSVTATSTTNFGSGVSSTTECTVGTTATGSGSVSNNTVSGSASVGSGATCSNSTGYSDPNGYIQLDTSCSTGNFANAQGVAGAGGLSMCADASSGSSCSVGVSGGGTSNYGGGGGSAGVSAGGEGIGACGGVTFTGGVATIQYCGSLAFDVGVDFCLNGSVNYGNVIGRMEPFASRAVAQAAKCAASGTAAKDCAFTTGDLMANAAAPYYGRAKDFFNSNKQFVAGPAVAVWKDAKSVNYRATNYAKSAAKYTGSKLTGTYYNASGQVLNAANQIVDVAGITKQAAEQAGATMGKGINYAANTVAGGATNVANTVASGVTSTASTVAGTVSSGVSSATKSVSKAFKKW